MATTKYPIMKKPLELDQVDLEILTILSKDAKTSYAEMGKQLFVSGGTIHVRIKKLMDAGVIIGSKLDIDYTKLDFDIIAFLGIYLQQSQLYDSVSDQLKEIPEVVEAHYTTGMYSIFAKVICKDTEHLRQVLSSRIQTIEGIERTETFISLQESISRPAPVYVHNDEEPEPKVKTKRKASSLKT